MHTDETQRTCHRFPALIEGEFVARDNRFRVHVTTAGKTVSAYLANPGRLQELLVPGRPVWLTPVADTHHRKTAYNLTLIQHPEALVSLNSHLPNVLIAKALRQRRLSGFQRFTEVAGEVALGNSRLDFRLARPDGEPAHATCWVEVKSVTLVEEGIAQFPDAPTARGRRHLRELIAARKRGDGASVIFVVQRYDATRFTPRDSTDPEFGDTLRAAAQADVDIRAFRCSVTPSEICLEREIPVQLDAPPPEAIIPAEAACGEEQPQTTHHLTDKER
ncbi:MAG: DNA/RNA nuclease SfsA [Anaerolineae bacterium]